MKYYEKWKINDAFITWLEKNKENDTSLKVLSKILMQQYDANNEKGLVLLDFVSDIVKTSFAVLNSVIKNEIRWFVVGIDDTMDKDELLEFMPIFELIDGEVVNFPNNLTYSTTTEYKLIFSTDETILQKTKYTLRKRTNKEQEDDKFINDSALILPTDPGLIGLMHKEQIKTNLAHFTKDIIDE